MMAQKPLMLKEYLEMDSGSESSSSSGFRCAPRRVDSVRGLLDAELRRGGDNASRRRQNVRSSRSKSAALTKLTSVINVMKLLPFSSSSSSGGGGHSDGFSRRLIRGGFWKPKKACRRDEPEKVRVLDIVRLSSFQEDPDEFRSFVFPSPVVSSCSSCSETVSSSASDFLLSSLSSSENLDVLSAAAASESKKESSPPSTPKSADAAAGRRRPPPKEIEASPECQLEEEEKEQLSPVSVMDFPYEPEDEDEEDDDSEDESSISSPSFNQSLANIERTKLQLLQKIRRFESLADLDTVDLEKRFDDVSTSGDEHETASGYESDGVRVERRTAETRAWALLEELRSAPSTNAPPLGSFEKLLLDFFVQGFRRLDEDGGGDDDDDEVTIGRPSELMLGAARDWMRGHVDGIGRDVTITEMERNGRWRYQAEEEEALGADMEGYVLGLLLDELVADLGSS